MFCIGPTSPSLRTFASASLVVLGMTTAITAPSTAQTAAGPSALPPEIVAGPTPGPIVNGRHRQPSKAEVDARELAQGRSPASIAREDRAKDRQVDELYRDLMNAPVPTDPGPSR
jgi:hypothetical protein